MTSSDSMIEKVARAIYDAEEPLSGDHVATVLISSDHLFPQGQHLEGNPTSKAYQLAAMDVCRTIARAAIEATAPLVERAFKDGLAYAGNVHNPDPELAWQQSRVRASLQGDER